MWYIWEGDGWVFNDINENEVKVSVFVLSTQKLKDLGFNSQPIEGVIHEIIINFKECGCLAWLCFKMDIALKD